MRTFYIAVKEPHPEYGYWVPADKFTPEVKGESYQFIQDSMEPMKSMLDGKMYDSKSAYARSLKQAGYAELGGQPLEFFTKKREYDSSKDIETSIRRAFEQLERRK